MPATPQPLQKDFRDPAAPEVAMLSKSPTLCPKKHALLASGSFGFWPYTQPSSTGMRSTMAQTALILCNAKAFGIQILYERTAPSPFRAEETCCEHACLPVPLIKLRARISINLISVQADSFASTKQPRACRFSGFRLVSCSCAFGTCRSGQVSQYDARRYISCAGAATFQLNATPRDFVNEGKDDPPASHLVKLSLCSRCSKSTQDNLAPQKLCSYREQVERVGW